MTDNEYRVEQDYTTSEHLFYTTHCCTDYTNNAFSIRSKER